MLENEARWLGERIAACDAKDLTPMINIGSSTSAETGHRWPYLEQYILGPLNRRGVKVISCDLKAGDGVDIVGDLLNSEVQALIKAHGARALLCCNVLEHVTDPAAFAQACTSLLPQSGLLFVSVPCSFPFHPDPIDNGLRPSRDELVDLFTGTVADEFEVVMCNSYGDALRKRPAKLLWHGFNAANPFINQEVRRMFRDRFNWLNKNYEVACARLMKL